jgi:hypothetical protein
MTVVRGILGDLINQLRNATRDTEGIESNTTLWDIEEWIEYLNAAQDEICRRALVLSDSLSITVKAGVKSYSISDRILDVDEKAYFSYDGSYLLKRTESWLDFSRTTWRSDTGAPTDFVVYPNLHNIVITPEPTGTYNNSAISFPVKRLPNTPLSVVNVTPEINSKYYEDLKAYALYRAYSKSDAETKDEDRAKMYLALFDMSIGPRSNATVEQIMKEEPSTLRVMVRR